MRAALIIGVNFYEHVSPLFGCVNDAYSVKNILERNDGGVINFDCKILTGVSATDCVTRADIKDNVEALFKKEVDIALFYFAGHGHIEESGGYILGSDSRRGDEGVSLSDVLKYANLSPARNKVVILDSCHSGAMASSQFNTSLSVLSEGVTVLTASTESQYASEENGKGLFTTLFVDALSGSAANLVGDVTPGSVYAHIDQSLGEWEQRPVFKTNVKRFVSLRKVKPPINIEDLRKITELFPSPGFVFELNPTFEPEAKGRMKNDPEPIPENVEKFRVLQKLNRLNLVVPVDAPHMWNAAMESKGCRLTTLGEHYRRLVEKTRI